MNVAVIIPVGPGHEKLAELANRSVAAAWKHSPGPFSICRVAVVPDPHGELGRSRARNRGMDESPADWHFLLDADDEMCANAFTLVDLDAPATFGAVCLNGRVYAKNVWPCTRRTIYRRGATGTLSMGCFLRGDLGLRFDESLDVAEDFEFYLRLPGFTKRREPLVSIGYDQPSAGGPRGYVRVSWIQACDAMIAGIHRHSLPRPEGLAECENVLDVGAGVRPMQWYEAERHVCVEPWPGYCEVLRHAGYEVIEERAVPALAALATRGQQFDAIYLLDVIEHLEREEGLELLALMQRVARRQIVVYTPYGFKTQDADPWGYGAHELQKHRSGWLPTDFPGWRTQLFIPRRLVVPEGFYALWDRSTAN